MNWKSRLLLVSLGFLTIAHGMSLVGRGHVSSGNAHYLQVMLPECLIALGAVVASLSALPSEGWVFRRITTQRKLRSYSQRVRKTRRVQA